MASSVKKPGLLLAHPWDGEQDVTGWWMSEKMDGVRAYWDGRRLLSRLGNQFFAPKWFTQGWPKLPLDGELWMGRGLFQQTIGAVRKHKPLDAEWKKVRYIVFDCPSLGEGCEARFAEVGRIICTFLDASAGPQPIRHSPILGATQQQCKGLQHLADTMREYVRCGAEGLMLRQPESLYEPKRSHTLLKVKQFQTAEGKVIGHEPGKGKHKGRLGALVVKLPKGEVCVGTGLTDRERENPPKVGSIITYRFQELTNAGIPRFPSYVGVRRVS